MSLETLKEDIRNKSIRGTYLFYGPEDYLKSLYIDSLLKQAMNEELKMMNLAVFEGKPDFNKISGFVATAPFGASKRVAIIKNSGLFKAGAGDDAEGVRAIIERVPEHACVIFSEESADMRLKLIGLVKSKGLVVEFDYQKPDDIVKWIIKKVRASSVDIDPKAAELLVEFCDVGLETIASELDKLCAYKGKNGRITKEDVAKVCSRSPKSRIFDLTDCISSGDKRGALDIFDELTESREPVQKIMVMIERHFRTLLQVKMYAQDGMRQDEIVARLKILPFLASKYLRQVKTFDRESLEDAVIRCHEYDLKFKTGRMDDRLGAEMLIAEFTK